MSPTRIAVVVLMLMPLAARAGNGLPAGFVYLRDIAPGILQNMRYATPDNFTGRPLPGYDGGECVLRRDVAQALAKVEADLAGQNLTLKTYDCYRPQRATLAMWRWASDGARDGVKRFYPALPKRTLFSGYISARSAHSTGTAVDLTLVPLPVTRAAPFDRNAAYGSCAGPAQKRAPDNSLDMGTGFDCFDDKSHTRSAGITPAQRRWREVLGAAMRRHGFKNYFREWWHFSYGPQPKQVYDFPIAPRR